MRRLQRVHLPGHLGSLLILLLLAAFSWWVAQEALHAIRPRVAAPEPQRHPDYFLQGFQIRSYALDGRLAAMLSGATLQHIPADQTLRIGQPVLHAVSAQGVVLDASARQGISNADGSNVQLLGDAEVRRSAPAQSDLLVRGAFLNLFPQQYRLSSDRPTTVERDGSRMGAQRLDVDALTGKVTMQGRVSVLLPPKPTR